MYKPRIHSVVASSLQFIASYLLETVMFLYQTLITDCLLAQIARINVLANATQL